MNINDWEFNLKISTRNPNEWHVYNLKYTGYKSPITIVVSDKISFTIYDIKINSKFQGVYLNSLNDISLIVKNNYTNEVFEIKNACDFEPQHDLLYSCYVDLKLPYTKYIELETYIESVYGKLSNSYNALRNIITTKVNEKSYDIVKKYENTYEFEIILK